MTSIRPARGTRPSNRRELILEAAAELFYRNGYAAVGMSDIAEAVAIGPSALYRHFGSKQELLGAVVLVSADRLRADLATAVADDLVGSLARAAVDQRRAGMTWRREVRYASDSARVEFRARARSIRSRTAELISIHRPDLTAEQADLAARCALAVVASLSFHSIQLPDARLIDEVRRMLEAVLTVDYAVGEPPLSSPGVGAKAVSRREEILGAAAELFAAHGFSSVGVEDIGRRIGIAGPSIYNHFDSKSEILDAVLLRGNEWLRFGLDHALAEAVDERDALSRLMASYTDFALGRPEFVQLLLTEVIELPPSQRRRVREVQLEYIDEWVLQLRAVEKGLDGSVARLRVQAAIHIANEIALGKARTAPIARTVIRAVGEAVLHSSLHSSR